MDNHKPLNSRNLLVSPSDLEVAFFVYSPMQQECQQIVVDTEFIINLIQVGILALHEQIDFFLCDHHLQQIGLQAADVVEEIDVLVLRRGITDKSHVELAHARVVEVHLRNQDLVDILKVDAGGKALLGAEQYPVSAIP